MSNTTMTDSNDRMGQTCTECGVGRYQETSIHDDWDGVLHCTNKACNHEVIRYKWKDDPKPQPEPVKSKLSPAAQAVLDAYINAPCGKPRRTWVAAALKAAADQVVPESTEPKRTINIEPEKDVAFIGAWHIWNSQRKVRSQLLAIVAELEAQAN